MKTENGKVTRVVTVAGQTVEYTRLDCDCLFMRFSTPDYDDVEREDPCDMHTAEDDRSLSTPISVVHIVEGTAFGRTYYYAACPQCRWRCHGNVHFAEADAVSCAYTHQDAVHP